ncbi:CRISPR-associated endonuclease Cas2 [Infirmifilum lucidum]|uniref:CRISPR-associated endoribonuclease Cas2 n=1 Tax=Infirmifilum lucidum TaxID=2776706 RepID=A0A7L9FG72_9CREN|nr:CRISPR-associated endonuclease Cas2 [Infirmifilum lucidum]QOJ78818.1 CRISPR-associated endonuclease Cas2 [Infirmifilum lucidum]
MRLVVVYDISDNGDRQRLASRLLGLGLTRVQRSAFVGRGGYGHAKDVYRFIQRYVRGEGDSVIIFVVPDESFERALVAGRPMAPLAGVARVVV